jgi:hypothetical protein
MDNETLLNIIDALGIKGESNLTNASERDMEIRRLISVLQNLDVVRIPSAQRAKVNRIQEGYNNTKYFHLIANGEYREMNIFYLERGGMIVGDAHFQVYITRKCLGSHPKVSSLWWRQH